MSSGKLDVNLVVEILDRFEKRQSQILTTLAGLRKNQGMILDRLEKIECNLHEVSEQDAGINNDLAAWLKRNRFELDDSDEDIFDEDNSEEDKSGEDLDCSLGKDPPTYKEEKLNQFRGFIDSFQTVDDYRGLEKLAKTDPFFRGIFDKVEMIIENCGHGSNLDNKKTIKDMIYYSMAGNLQMEDVDTRTGTCAVCGYRRTLKYAARGEENSYPMGESCHGKIKALHDFFSLVFGLSQQDREIEIGDYEGFMRAVDAIVDSNRPSKRRRIGN